MFHTPRRSSCWGPTLRRLAAAGTWIGALCGAGAARADDSRDSVSRYADEALPAALGPASAGAGQPLLRYRREDAAEPSVGAEPANPLRSREQPAAAETLPFMPTAPAEFAPPPRADGVGLEDQAVATAAAPRVPAEQPLADPLPTALPVAAEQLATPAQPLDPPLAVEPILRYDRAVETAEFTSEEHVNAVTSEAPSLEAAASPPPPLATPGAATDESRRLAAPSTDDKTAVGPQASLETTGRSRWSFTKLQSLSTAGGGLAVVIGLFLASMVLLRRGGAGKSSGAIPSEAFAVLGRAPLTATANAHLLRLGNKLVLVAVTAEGAHPLTEVTDPLEVDRIAGLCASNRSIGPAAEFQQVLAQLAREPARGFLGQEASSNSRRRA